MCIFVILRTTSINIAQLLKSLLALFHKNYIFCESVNGAKDSAIIYSIVETAKVNELTFTIILEFLITELSKRKKENFLVHIDDLSP